MLSSVDLVVECRDYRVPLSSRNPMFEDALQGKPRIIVYTKKDLGRGINARSEDDRVSKDHRANVLSGAETVLMTQLI